MFFVMFVDIVVFDCIGDGNVDVYVEFGEGIVVVVVS